MGDLFDDFKKKLDVRFETVRIHSPDASRPTSSEVYVICKNYLAQTRVPLEVEVKEEPKKHQFTIKGNFQ